MPAFVDMCRSASEGTTNRVRIKEDRLMASQIPLPPIDEQRRLVRIAHGASERITEAADLRRAIRERSDQLCRAVFAENGGAALTPTPMSELVEWRTLDTDVEADGSYRFAGVYCFGRGVFAGECRSGTEFAYKRLTRLRPGDLVYPKLMAWEGALGIVPETCDGLYVSPEFPVFSVKSDRVLPETLDTYFRDPAVWPALGGVSTGTNVRRRRLNPKDFLKYEFPLPSMRTQLRLREIRARLSGIEAEAGHVARDLDALLPSILDRAFRGEL
jgi:type I restriction enzyme S subunit